MECLFDQHGGQRKEGEEEFEKREGSCKGTRGAG